MPPLLLHRASHGWSRVVAAERISPARAVLGGAVVLGALQILFFGASMAAAAVPNGAILAHLGGAVRSGELPASSYPMGHSGIPEDRYSECIALTNGIGDSGHRGLLAGAIAEPDLGPCSSAVPLIRAAQRSPHITAEEDYYRYWHGYDVLTRPLLALLGVTATRWVAGTMLFAGLACLAVAVGRRSGWFAAGAIAIPLAVTTDIVDVPASIPHAISLAVALGSAAMCAYFARPDRPGTWIGLPLIAGAVFAFVDLMTYPPLAWALCATAVALCVRARSPGSVATRRVFLSGAVAASSWLVGYGGTWATKWVIDLVAFGYRAFRDNVLSEITYRMGHGGVSAWTAIRTNYTWWRAVDDHWNLAVSLGILVPLIVAIAIRRRHTHTAMTVALVWPLALPFGWYALIRNQSAIQAFFTFRDISASVAVLAVGLAVALVPVTSEHASPAGGE